MRQRCAFGLSSLFLIVLFLPHSGLAQSCVPPHCFKGKFYNFDVVAQSGQTVAPGTLSGLGTGPSVNEKGEVAFVGHIASGSTPLGDGIFLWKPSAPTNPSYVTTGFLSTNRGFLNSLQLNDKEEIAALDRVSGSPPAFLLRIWHGSNPGTLSLVARSGFPTDPFSIVYSSPALNNKSNVTFSASDPKSNDLLATPNAAKRPPYNELFLSIPVRPQIADNNQVVVRAGNTTTSPIILFNNDLNPNTQVIVASAAEFDALGQSPGISRDGVVVAFAGSMNSTGAAHWGTNSGPGVFVAILQNGTVYKIVRVAGFSTQAGIGTKFIAVNTKTGRREEGLPWCDPNATCVTGGELEDLPPAVTPTPAYFQTFTPSGFASSSEWQSHIGVTHLLAGDVGLDGDSVVVSFVATPNVSDSNGLGLFSGLSGLWSVRADIFDGGLMGFYAHVYRPSPIIQIGDKFPVDGTTITAIALYDQLANAAFDGAGVARNQSLGDHRVAVWLSTSANGQAILRGTYVQQLGGSTANTQTGCGETGTLGALVKKSGITYVLSNDHVFGDPLSGTQNGASPGNTISSPGSADYNGDAAPGIATFSSAATLNSGIDAALAKVDVGALNNTGQIYNVGIPSSTNIAANTFAVSKQGRTTSLTCARITAFGTTIKANVAYDLCSGGKFSVPFTNLIQIQTNDVPFSLPGDSGSLIVKQATSQPVGLLFAGDQPQSPPYNTYAIPISTVASKLGITFVGGPQHAVSGCHNGPVGAELGLNRQEVDRVRIVKEKYEEQLMENPSVLGVGIGSSEDNSGEGVVVVILERGKTATIPALLEGIRTRVVYGEAIHALGIRGSQEMNQ